MDRADAVAAFSSVTAEEKAEFLASLVHELTIVARDSYEVGGDGFTNPARMRTINEIQHRLSDVLSALVKGDLPRCPEDALFGALLEHSTDADLQGQLSQAIDRCWNALGART